MKKDCILLIAIFIFLYFFNVMTPMLNEDYSAVFVWPRGVPNLGELPENVQRVSTFSDFFNNVKNYYVSEGGRVPGSIPGGLFSLLGKAFFNPLNALMMIILIIEIYWITHEGRITFSFTSSNIFWIAFCLWSFNPSLIDSCLWMSGASNYLWMSVIVLAFLIPYVQNYYNSSMLQDSSFCLNTGIFVTGILAGWSHETTGCWLILILGYWLFICWKRKKFHLWKLFGSPNGNGLGSLQEAGDSSFPPKASGGGFCLSYYAFCCPRADTTAGLGNSDQTGLRNVSREESFLLSTGPAVPPYPWFEGGVPDMSSAGTPCQHKNFQKQEEKWFCQLHAAGQLSSYYR